jgi:hypothetical protein
MGNDNGNTAFLEEKLALLEEILSVTREADLEIQDSNDEDAMRFACDEFVALYGKRTELFDRLNVLDDEMKQAGFETVNEEIIDIAKQIRALDELNMEKGELLREFIRKNVKEINAAKLVRKYSEP